MTIEDQASDALRALHTGGDAPGRPALQANLQGMLEGWREWPEAMDFVASDSPNHRGYAAMTALYARWIEAHLGGLPGGRVLDLACGSGRSAALTAPDAVRVGLDATRPSLQAARRHLPGDRLIWADVADLATLDLGPEPFDAALAIELLCYLDDPAPVLAALFARLRPGAPLLVSVEAWPGALLAAPPPLDQLARAARERVVHVPGERWVRLDTAKELATRLRAAGFEVEAVAPTHVLLDGPLAPSLRDARLRDDPTVEDLLAIEEALQGGSPPLPGRAWIALARRPLGASEAGR